MKSFAEQCATNCKLWRTRLAELEKNESSSKSSKDKDDENENYPPEPYRSLSPSQPQQDYHTVFPLSLPAHFYHPHPLSVSSSIADNESVAGSDARTAVEYMDVEVPAGESEAGMVNLNGKRNGYADSISIPSSSRSSSPTFVMMNGPPPDVVPTAFNFQYTQQPPSLATEDLQGISPFDGSPATTEATAVESATTSPRSEFPPPRGPGPIPTIGVGVGAPSVHSSAASIRSVSTHTTGTCSNFGSVAGMGANERDSSIRTAYKLSVRKKKSFHRNSWTPSLTSPPLPSPSSAGAGIAAFVSTGTGTRAGAPE